MYSLGTELSDVTLFVAVAGKRVYTIAIN